MSTTCYFLEATNKIRRSLRRYASGSQCGSPLNHGYHNAMVALDVVEIGPDPKGLIREQAMQPKTDARWPAACHCGYVFHDVDAWQIFTDRLMRRSDTGEEIGLRDAGPGAMYDAHWYPEDMQGADGLVLMVILPDGHAWCVDGQASNCTRPGDKTHRCWCRHGTVPLITVDKNGETCAAGAGSIQTEKWHGFLRNGVLA